MVLVHGQVTVAFGLWPGRTPWWRVGGGAKLLTLWCCEQTEGELGSWYPLKGAPPNDLPSSPKTPLDKGSTCLAPHAGDHIL
jgi:hypothetical protein